VKREKHDIHFFFFISRNESKIKIQVYVRFFLSLFHNHFFLLVINDIIVSSQKIFFIVLQLTLIGPRVLVFPFIMNVFMLHVFSFFFFPFFEKKKKIYFLLLVLILLIRKVSIHFFFILNFKIHLHFCFLSF